MMRGLCTVGVGADGRGEESAQTLFGRLREVGEGFFVERCIGVSS
jgi:hypothetical protein